MKKYRLAVVASHPIQYQAPFFRAIAEDITIDPMIYFAGKGNAISEAYDPEFGIKIKWDIPLIEGYQCRFLGSKFELPWLLLSRKEKADAILIFGWNSIGFLLVYAAAIVSRTPIFVRSESPLNQELLKIGFAQKIKRFILRALFRFVSAFLYIGEENRRFYEYLGVPAEKLFFAPYAVENERFFEEKKRFLPQRENLRKASGVSKDAKVILFVGKFIPKKRPMDLLRAYADLEMNDKALIFVGEGSLRKEMEDFIKENNLQNVHFAGFKNQMEVGRYYVMADVFVLPSGPGETWGLVVNEAMCFGLPIVISDMVGCAPDLVIPENNGYTFPSGDVNSLSKALSNLLNDQQVRKKFGGESVQRIASFSFKKDVEGIKRALESIMP